MARNFLYLLTLGFLLLAGCARDVDIFEPDPLPTEPDLVTASVLGLVLDEDGSPVFDAAVNLDGQVIFTNAEGLFYLKDREMPVDAYLTVEKAGYFAGSRRFYPSAGKVSRIRIILLDDQPIGSFQASSGGTVDLDGFSRISFSPDAVAYPDGSTYSGAVHVSATPLYTDDPDLFDKMPGDLVGVNNEQQLRALGSFGMVAAELRSDLGEMLQIREGETARMELRIAPEQLSTAPAEIPLWYFNEESGYWVEEGQAVRQGDLYLAEVPHFSFWNCDAPFPLVNLEGLVDFGETYSAYSYVRVCITAPGLNVTGSATLAQDGTFSGKVPKDEPLVITVKSNDFCSEPVELYSAEIGPFSGDVVLDPIPVNVPPGVNAISVTGHLVDCDQNPVQEGLAKIQYGAYTSYVATEDGAFSYLFYNCDLLPVTVTGLDYTNEKESLPVTLPNDLNVDFGIIDVCEDLSSFIKFVFDHDSTLFISPTAQWAPNSGTMNVSGSGADSTFVWFNIPGETTGTYTVSGIEASLDAGFGPWGSIETMEVIVTYANGVGDFIAGTMSGDYIEFDPGTQGNMVFPFSGSFKVLLE